MIRSLSQAGTLGAHVKILLDCKWICRKTRILISYRYNHYYSRFNTNDDFGHTKIYLLGCIQEGHHGWLNKYLTLLASCLVCSLWPRNNQLLPLGINVVCLCIIILVRSRHSLSLFWALFFLIILESGTYYYLKSRTYYLRLN
jgi:hypothetical protein